MRNIEGWIEATLEDPEPAYPSLPSSFFEGIRRSQARGLFEHAIINQALLRIAKRFVGMKIDKHAQFRRAEKVDEGMALKIWSENIAQCSLP